MAESCSQGMFSDLMSPVSGTARAKLPPINLNPNACTIYSRAVDPDPHGSVFIFPPGGKFFK